MSAEHPKGKIIFRLLLYSFVTALAWSLLHTYSAVRDERIRTRLSMRMSGGEHEVVVALPSGHYQIQFTAQPNISSATIVPGRSVLPAVISTRLVRADGQFIVYPTSNEYVTFSIEGADAFRPQRLLVNITTTQECQIYMNLAPGF